MAGVVVAVLLAFGAGALTISVTTPPAAAASHEATLGDLQWDLMMGLRAIRGARIDPRYDGRAIFEEWTAPFDSASYPSLRTLADDIADMRRALVIQLALARIDIMHACITGEAP